MFKVSEFPVFIDFEATNLSDDSFPIQVAWNLPCGKVKSYFIDMRDFTDWDDGHWSYDVEHEVHGISQDILREHGVSIDFIAGEMKKDLSGVQVYSDGRYFDQGWLNQLLSEASFGVTLKPLIDSAKLFQDMLREKGYWKDGAREELFGRCMSRARKKVPGRRHLADNDVEYLKAMYLEIKGC